MHVPKRTLVFVTYAAFAILCIAVNLRASQFHVLVVMSYEEDNPWCRDVREGISEVLAHSAKLTFFYLDTKKNIAGGPEKARKAYEYFIKSQPAGVIAVDDYAQSMFVIEYLREKVSTPVMFCGVNAQPEKYGYPAKNVSGILERNFIGPSIAMAKQLVPTIEKVGFIARDSSSGRAIQNQVKLEMDTYFAKVTGFKLVSDIDQLLEAIAFFNQSTDLLAVAATKGILDPHGKPLTNKQVTEIITKTYSNPVIGFNRFHVQFGALCAVTKSAETQGRVAAEMLLAAMEGTPVSELTIRQNKHGKRLLNVNKLKSLGIHPGRRTLLGTELINNGSSQ